MRTKHNCEHLVSNRVWENGKERNVLLCGDCKKILRTIPRCPHCYKELRPAKDTDTYYKRLVFFECPNTCIIPILYNLDNYYGDSSNVGKEIAIEELLKPAPWVLNEENKTPVFAYTDKNEKPTYRWHYGRKEWLKI